MYSSGVRATKETELLELDSDDTELNSLIYDDLPKYLYGASGAFVQNKMMICGGCDRYGFTKKAKNNKFWLQLKNHQKGESSE